MNTVLPFLYSHFWSITFRIWDLSFRGMREHIHLQVLEINCEGLWPIKNALRWILLVHLVWKKNRMLVHGFPWPACEDLSASVSRMHACHFESWLHLRIVPIFWNNFLMTRWSRCWRQTAAGIDDSPGTTRSTKLSIVQVIDFPLSANRGVSPFFHSNGHPWIEQSKWSNRTAGVSLCNRTVTNRSKSRTKTCASSCICTVLITVSTVIWFLDLLRKVSIFSELKTPLLSIVQFVLQIPRYFAVTICLSWGVRSSKPGAQGFRSWGSPFWIMPPDSPFSFPNFVSYQVHPKNFMVCPAEAFNPNSLAFRRIEFIGSEFWATQPWTLFPLRIATAPWVPSFLDLALRLLLTISMSIQATNATIPSKTCNHDTRDDADNYTTIFFILPSIDKGFFHSSRRTGL